MFRQEDNQEAAIFTPRHTGEGLPGKILCSVAPVGVNPDKATTMTRGMEHLSFEEML